MRILTLERSLFVFLWIYDYSYLKVNGLISCKGVSALVNTKIMSFLCDVITKVKSLDRYKTLYLL